MRTQRRTPAGGTRRIVGLVGYEGVQPLDLVGPHEVFASANRWLDAIDSAAPRYLIEVWSADAATIVGESGLQIVPTHRTATDQTVPAFDTLIVAGGDGVIAACDDSALVRWIAAAAVDARRIASVCSGTFLLAEAGLISGRRVTTHWRRAEQLAAQFPDVEVDPEPIFIEDGKYWTSAGVTAGIDLCLAMIDADHGAECAQQVARSLVMFVRRPGGQSQFATAIWSGATERDGLAAARDRIHGDPSGDLRVAALADHAGMSERNFIRMFTKDFGQSPARYVERVRVEAARSLLESTAIGLSPIASSCGFGSAEVLRRAFHRQLNVSPREYRERFSHQIPQGSTSS